MQAKKKIILIGATSAIAHQCALYFGQKEACDFVLVGRNEEKLQNNKEDLLLRCKDASVKISVTDFLTPVCIVSTVDALMQQGPVDIVLIAQGSLLDQKHCQEDVTYCDRAMQINGVSPILFAECFAKYLQKTNYGTLAILSSVAGDRMRKTNYIYGAAKGLVNHYVQGLRRRFYRTKVNIVLVKPGPTATPMTIGKIPFSRLAEVEKVAATIAHGIHKGKKVIYAPRKWCFWMMLVRSMPTFLLDYCETRWDKVNSLSDDSRRER